MAPTKPVYAVLTRGQRGPDERPGRRRAEAAADVARELRVVRWGLVPFWAKDPSIGSRMINARVETVDAKPAFRRAFAKRRCLLPADGFYEWQKVAGPGQGRASSPTTSTAPTAGCSPSPGCMSSGGTSPSRRTIRGPGSGRP